MIYMIWYICSMIWFYDIYYRMFWTALALQEDSYSNPTDVSTNSKNALMRLCINASQSYQKKKSVFLKCSSKLWWKIPVNTLKIVFNRICKLVSCCMKQELWECYSCLSSTSRSWAISQCSSPILVCILFDPHGSMPGTFWSEQPLLNYMVGKQFSLHLRDT